MVQMFKNWPIGPFYGAAQLHAIEDRGAVPLITWQPASSGAREAHDTYPLPQIAGWRLRRLQPRSGRRSTRGRPILLHFRPQQEKNLYPWGVGANAGTGDFSSLHRRGLVSIFREQGANNVRAGS